MKTILLIMFMALSVANGSHAGETYEIDPVHAHVGFRVEHFGLSTMVCAFSDVKGTINFDAEEITQSSAAVVIATGSVLSEADERVNAIKSPAFLHAQKFPQITFETTAIARKDAGLEITGTLSVRDITREVTFPATMVGPIADPWGKQRIGFSGELAIARKRFGIDFDRALSGGQPMVGDTVTIDISVEAVLSENGPE